MTQDARGRPSSLDTGTSRGQDELAVLFSEFAREAQRQPDAHATLVEIVKGAVALVPGCDEGSISVVVGRRKVSSEAASGALPRAVDALQERLGEGPCLDAAYEHETVRVPDLATDGRWPRFGPGAVELGVRGMLSFQLYVDGDDLGALNLFARSAGAFDDESEHIGLLFASHAAVAYAAAQEKANLVRKVTSRQVIGQAQGILMERHKVAADDAFALLVQVSQRRNEKLRDVAERLVHSGHLAIPHPDIPPP